MTAPPVPAVRLPPWTWLYLGLAVALVIPSSVTSLRAEWAQFGPAAGVQVPGIGVLRLLLAAITVPTLFLAAGVVVVAIPALRRWLVEYQHPVANSPAGRPAKLQESIQEFVHQHAAGTEVRFTGSGGDYARIYPVTWRTARILVFTPFLALWQTQRQAAEALILHEIAHRRQGEHLILGLGSPFAWLVRVWGSAFVVLSALPVAILAVNHSLLGTAAAPELVRDAAQPLLLLLFPVAALWLAELAADDWAARVAGPDAVLAALSPATSAYRRRRQSLPLLDHPPARLRRALVAPGHQPVLLPVLMLACWPAVIVLRFLVTVITVIPESMLAGWSAGDQPALIGHGAGIALRSAIPASLGCLLILLSWPVLSTWWPRLWVPRSGPRRAVRDPADAGRPPARAYLLASALPALLLLTAAVPAPGLPGLPTASSTQSSTLPSGIEPAGHDVIVRITRIIRFNDLGGRPGRSQQARNRLLASTWTLVPNGRAAFDAPGLRRGLYPLTGRWRASATLIDITATSTKTAGQGTLSASMTALLNTAAQPRTMQLIWTSTTPPGKATRTGTSSVPVVEIYRATVQVSVS